MSQAFAPLAPTDEDALHRARLLNTEERAFKRVTKRLLAPDAFFNLNKSLLTPHSKEATGVDSTGTQEDHDSRRPEGVEEYTKFREDVLIDFATFEANLVRTQLLLTSNVRERERYAAEKLRIQEAAQQVRENTGELRAKLEEAQKLLEQRKGWDKLAEKITSNRMLRTREEQQTNIEKLNNEIAELEQESRDYASTWAERRQQFGRIVDEGMQMLRLIRDEKEEVERREGMEGQEDGDDTDTARGPISNVGTPRPEGGTTPLHIGPDGDQNEGMLHPQSKTPLRGSPAAEEEGIENSIKDTQDADMADEGELEDDEDDGDSTAASIRGADGIEEQSPDEKMDTT